MIFLSLTWANHILWYGNYDKALQLAQKEKKPLMVLLIKKNCPQCNAVIKNAFMNSSIVDILNQKVISVIVTLDSKISYPRELYYTTVFPALFFTDYKNEIFLSEPVHGNINKQEVKNLIDKVLF